MEAIIEEESQRKQARPSLPPPMQPSTSVKNDHADNDQEGRPWIMQSMVVKIKNKKLLNGKLYKAKGTILSTDDFIAEIKTFDPEAIVKLDQDDLETVIPQPGNPVLICQGKHRGQVGILERIDVDNYCGIINIEGVGEVRLDYEYFSKIQE